MSAPFTSRCITLGELFATARLRMPDYQRGYAWTPAEAGQLLEDVLLALDDAEDVPDSDDAESFEASSADDYFLGAIVLMEAASADAPGAPAHDIVDGLQRILTLTILLALLRDLSAPAAPEASARAAAALGSPSAGGGIRWHVTLAGQDQRFFEAYVLQPGASSLMPTEDLSESEQRILDVREHLAEILVTEEPERLAALVSFLLEHCHCAVITTTTIDRAHRIFSVLNDRGRPLSRGDILKAQILEQVPADRRQRYAERWSALDRNLGGLEALLSHVRTIEGRSRSRIIEDIRELMRRSGSAAAFLDHMLLPYGAVLERITALVRGAALPQDASAAEITIARRLRYLGWLGSADWMPPLILWWHLIDGAADRLAPFVARLERLAFAMRLLGLGAEKRARRYQAAIEDIRHGSVERPGSALDVSRDEQRLVLFNLRNIHARSQLSCKLVLLRINDELAGAPQALDPSRLTVEHVLPQKPPRNSRWREWFPLAEEREACTHSLGNLILVSRDRNERARNLELEAKLAIYFAGGEAQPHITRELSGLTEWRPDDVRRREERMIGALRDIWQLGPAQGSSRVVGAEATTRSRRSAQA